jgi:hypothetical protein
LDFPCLRFFCVYPLFRLSVANGCRHPLTAMLALTAMTALSPLWGDPALELGGQDNRCLSSLDSLNGADLLQESVESGSVRCSDLG